MRLLLAEDDATLRSVLVRGLSEEGYVVDAVGRGDDAVEALGEHDYALAILDWRMPGLSGLEVLGRMRARRMSTPVLMLTARDTAEDRITGLDTGADDYLVKPFDLGELLARLRALLRRPREGGEPELHLGGLTLDPRTRTAVHDGRSLALTATEHGILELLLRRAPAVVRRRDIAQHVWRDEYDPIGSNTIDVHVARLRAKLVGSGVRIVTVRGIGFRAVAEGAE